MANVSFKRGSQTALNALKAEVTSGSKTYVEGSFYLTSDTNRLYVAQTAENLVELNKSIHIVENLTDLPVKVDVSATGTREVDVGQFYYVIPSSETRKDGNDKLFQGNILAVCTNIDTEGNVTWVQINPDTNDNDNDHITSMTFSNGVTVENADDNTKEIQYTVTLATADVNGKAETPITATFVIKPDDLNAITGVNVGLKTDVTKDASDKLIGVTLGTDGEGANKTDGAIKILNGDNIDVTLDAEDNIKISAVDTTYTIASKEGETNITLQDGKLGTDLVDIAVVGDTTHITVDGTESNTLKIKHNTQEGITSTDAIYANNTKTNPDFGGSIIVPKIKVDDAGHITSIDDVSITIPDPGLDKYEYSISQLEANSDGDLIVKLINGEGAQSGSATAAKSLFYNITVDGTTAPVYNQNSLGSFYSADKVDDLINKINPLTYKGVVNKASDLDTATATIGDAYMIGTSGTYYGVNCYAGQLIIATAKDGATENDDGILAADDIEW